MPIYNSSFDSVLIVYLYLVVYNVSLLILFSVLFSIVNSQFKTVFSFNEFRTNSFFVTAVAISLFSMAGVPPMTGFFTKLLILSSLLNSEFLLLYVFFFALLFVGLYFYIQNIRFLYTSEIGVISYQFDQQLRLQILPMAAITAFSIFLIGGFVFLDELILIMSFILC